MRQKIFLWLKRPFQLIYWFFKGNLYHIPIAGKNLMKKRKTVYETRIEHLFNFRNESPLNQISSPPWKMSVSGACLVLGKYVSSQIYHAARSNRWIEIYGFILGKRLGDLFIGITFIEITNILRSPNSAMSDPLHVLELRNEIASRYPELEIVCAIHSHPSGVLRPSLPDKICFLADPFPNIIVSPSRLLWGSPIKRLAAFYHSSGKVRRIKLFETDKKEPEMKDIDFRELLPSKEELMDVGELAIEVDYCIFKLWLVSHPNLSLNRLCQKLSEMFDKKIGFIPIYWDKNGWLYDPEMKVVDFFLKDGEHLIFPEFFEEVNY